MTNELDEIRHLLEEFAMSIYPHGKTPVWNSVSDGVKDLIDYAKSLDDTEHRRRCRMSIDICPDFGDIVSELTAENEKLTARIAELEAAQRWIPVSERLPEEGHKVLVLLTDGAISIDLIYGNDFLYENWVGDITHWMPLPKLPEVQDV